jgi:hypothetical protein
MDGVRLVGFASPLGHGLGRGAVTLASLGLLAVAACSRDGGGGGAAAGPYAKEVGEAVPRIEKAVGLPFKTPPKVERRSKDEVREFLTEKFNESMPAAEISGIERTYRRFGLIPDTLQLRPFMLELLTEQVVGYYDPATKVLYIVDGASADLVNVTVTHELVHALQDQYISLDSIQKVSGDNDRQVAAQAVIEGQATFEQVQAMLGSGNLAAALPGGWDRVRDMIRESQSAMPVFSGAPMIIQETLIFPYLSGAEFMRRFEEVRPGTVPFGEMPSSTEQVLHPSSYFETPDAPTRVTIPELASGARSIYTNNLGEFETRLFLFQHLQDQNAAIRGAAGWDGDRYVLFETDGGEGIAWVTVWDSKIDAGEFHDLLDTSVLRRYRDAKPRTADDASRVYEAGGRSLHLSTAEVNGRPVVLYVDVPTGSRANVIDVAKVTLQ